MHTKIFSKKYSTAFLFLFFSILSCLMSCSSNNSSYSDFFPSNFKGTKGYLKSLKATLIDKGKEIPNSNFYYNYQGNKLLEKRVYSPNNQEIYYQFIFEYELENITKLTMSNSNNFLAITDYKYDNQNRLIEQVRDNFKYQYIYENNDVLWKTFKLDVNNVFQPFSESFITIDSHNQILNLRETANNTITSFWQYDDKVSPMRGIVGINKTLENFSWDDAVYNNLINQNNDVTVQYEYNSENKPSIATYTKDNAVYAVVNYTYY